MAERPPTQDPSHPKYLNDPNRIWLSGQWRTPEGVEKRGEACARYRASEKGKAAEARRIFFKSGGVRWTKSVDNKEEIQRAMAAFRAAQKEERRGFNQAVS